MAIVVTRPNTRVQRTRVARCARPGSPLTRHPLGGRIILVAFVTLSVRCSDNSGRLISSSRCTPDSRLGGAAYLEVQVEIPDGCMFPPFQVSAYRPSDPASARFEIWVGPLGYADVAMPTGIWRVEARLANGDLIQVPVELSGGSRCGVTFVLTLLDCDPKGILRAA